jgi:hypothetical protein
MNLNQATTYALFSFTLLTGCSVEHTGVSVHGINHTEDELTYRFFDPNNEKNSAGGESILPFASGGIMCCYSVPDKWQPGIKVGVEVEVTLTSQPKGPNGFRTKKHTLIFELPKALDGKPNELWVVLKPDGKFELVASNFSPDHSQWPGTVKNWPVASKSYREKLIRDELTELQGTLQRFQIDQQKLKTDPYDYAKGQWEYDVGERKDMEIAKAYSGPNDERYTTSLIEEADRIVEHTQNKIAALKKELQ